MVRSRSAGFLGSGRGLSWVRAGLLLLLLALGWLPALSAMATNCAPAATQGTAPSDFQTYCWLDFTPYVDATARTAGGQNLTFNLPDGSVMSFNLKITSFTKNSDGSTEPGTATALEATMTPTYSGSAIGHAGFNGIPNDSALYEVTSGTTVNLSFTGIAVTPPAGGTSNYAFIAADGESTNSGETLSFTTNGSAWQLLSTITNTGYDPTLSGVGTTTVTETGTQNGASAAYVYGSFNNPTTVTATLHGSGLQGIMIGVRFASVTVTKVIEGARVNAADQFTYAIKTTGGTTLESQTTTGTALTGFPLASMPTIAASYPFVVNEVMAGGSVSTLSAYASRLTCVNNTVGSSTTGLPNNVNTTAYTFPALQFGDAIACTFTNSPNPSIFGTVYNDANHDFNLDNGETGTGLTGLYVKLAPSNGTTCSSPATVAAAVDPTTGLYEIPGVATGKYCLILSNNNTLTSITPSVPAGWVGTEAASGIRQISFSNTTSAQSQNFGLFDGSTYSGTVFADSGVGTGGIANNGIQDGSEAGIANVTVNAVSGGSTVASATTNGTGGFTLYIPATVTASVTATPVPPTGDLPTGGSAGTSGGTYTRPSVTFTPGSGTQATGLAFGMVPANTFAPTGAQTTQPGTIVLYPHTFVAGSGGQVTFTTTATATPTLAGWTETIYRDNNCDGAIDGADAVLSAAVTATAGQDICIIVKEFAPANAPLGSKNAVTVTAAFTYTNATPALAASLTLTDTTTIDVAGAVKISKQVTNVTQGGTAGTSNNASPGDTLLYSLLVTNPGTSAVTQLVVNDSTPAFTQYVSASCPGTLPANLTGCTVATQPAVGGQGGLRWTFTGSLAPAGQLTVSYQVTVSP